MLRIPPQSGSTRAGRTVIAERPVSVFIVGAAKAGTTTLRSVLDAHPEVCMSSLKEPNYFSAPELQNERQLHKRKLVTSIEGYRELFSHAGSEQILGEASVSYLAYPAVAERIRHYNPEARIIVSLREPVSRAISHHAMEKRLGYCNLTLETIFQNEGQYSDFHRHYFQNGLYHDRVARFIECFGEERVFVLLLGDLQTDPKSLLQKLFAFLRIDSGLADDISVSRENTAKAVRNPLLGTLYQQTWLRSGLKTLLPATLLQWASTALFEYGTHTEISADTQREMYAYYRDDRAALEQLIRRDLSAWDRPETG